MASLTERALAASLEKQLKKKTLDKITVKDITDDCGVNRQTFYYHFHDVYELVEWIFQEKADEFIRECDDITEWKDNILRLMDRLMDNKALVLNAYRSVNRHHAEAYLQKLAKPVLKDMVREFAGDMTIEKEDFDFIVDVFTFSFIGILTEWVCGNSMENGDTENADRFFMLIEATLESALKKFAK